MKRLALVVGLVIIAYFIAVHCQGQDTGGLSIRRGGGGSGGSATNAAGAASSMQFKQADGTFGGAANIFVDTNGNGSNLLMSGVLRSFDLDITNGIIKQGNTLWVDPVNGNNNTAARGKMEKPYLHLTNALAASVSGDTIKLSPGTHFITNSLNSLLKSNVTISLDDQTKAVIYGTVPLLNDYGLIGRFKVTGKGDFYISNAVNLLNTTNPATRFVIEYNDALKYDSGGSPRAIFEHDGGEGYYIAHGRSANTNYDIFVGPFGGKAYWQFNTLSNAAQVFEVTTTGSSQAPELTNGFFYAEGDLLITDTNSIAVEHLIALQGNAYLKVNKIFLRGGSTILLQGSIDGINIPTVECPNIFSTSNNASSLITADSQVSLFPSMPAGRIKNSRVRGPVVFTPINLGNGLASDLIIDNTELIAGSGQANTANGGGSLISVGLSRLNKPTTTVITNIGIYNITNYVVMSESAANPPTAPTNTLIYFTKDNSGHSDLYTINDIGTVVGPLGTGGAGGTPGGSTTELQYNNGGSFDGASGIIIPASTGETNLNISGLLQLFQQRITNSLINLGWYENRGAFTNIGISRLGGEVTTSNGLNNLSWSTTIGNTTNAATYINGITQMGGDVTVAGGSDFTVLAGPGGVFSSIAPAIFGDSITGSNGVTLVGTNNGAVRLQGTNTGFAEHTVFASGPSNVFVWAVQGAPSAGQAIGIHSLTVQAGSNQIVLTNMNVAGSTFNADQFESTGTIDLLSGALTTNLNIRGTASYDTLNGLLLTVTNLGNAGSFNVRTQLNTSLLSVTNTGSFGTNSANFANAGTSIVTNSLSVLGSGQNGMDNLTVTNFALAVKAGVTAASSNYWPGGLFYVLNQGFTNKIGDAALTNASSVVVRAGMLTNLYDQVEVNVSGASQAATATTNQIKVLYGSETIFDSGLGGMSNSAWRAQIFITRTGNSNQLCQATLWGGTLGGTTTNFNVGLLQTNGIDTTLQVQLASRKPGGITNDFIQAKLYPSPR
jgi:hypothetical protein